MLFFFLSLVQAVAMEVEATGKIESADYLRNRLDHDIKCCMVDVLKVNHCFQELHL